MANKNREVTTSFNVDITDLKKGIQEANRQIRLANAEFKAASSGMENWQKSTDGVSSKITQLDKVLSGQNKILDSYKQQLALIVAEQGENSKGADEMRIKIANQQAAINKTSAELDKYKGVLSDLEAEQNKSAEAANNQSNAYEDLKSSISEQESRLESLKKEYANTVLEQGKSSDAADKLSKEIEELSADLGENKKSLKNAESAAAELDKSLDDVGDSADDVVSGGLSTFTVALGNLAANVISSVINKMSELISTTIDVGANFEKSMANVQAISGATDDELQMLSDTAKEFGSTTQFSASESADALSYMALAGWDAKTSCDALGGVLDLAAASGMDLAAASDMVTDYMSAFSMEAKQSAYFADLLAYAQSNANTTAAGLGEAFKNCAANLNAAGQDIETTTALLSMMANQGLKGSEAGTALAAVMRDMTAKMENAGLTAANFSKTANNLGIDLGTLFTDLEAAGVTAKEFNTAIETSNGSSKLFVKSLQDAAKSGTVIQDVFGKAGTSVIDISKVLDDLTMTQKNYTISVGAAEIAVTDANGKYRDMTDILLDVEAATNGMEDAEKAAALSATFTSDSIKGLNLLLNAGVSEAASFEEELRQSSGTAKDMADIMNDNLNGDLTALGSQFEGVQIAIYEKFEPALRAGVAVLGKLLDAVNFVVEHSTEFTAAVAAMATGIGAYLAYTTALKVMTEGWQALTIVTKAQAAAQTVLNAVMSANPIGLVVAAIAALVAAFVVLWNKSETFRNFWTILWDDIKKTAAPVIETLSVLFKAAWEAIKAIWDSAVKYFAAQWKGIKGVFSVTDTVLSGFFKAAWESIKLIWNAATSYFQAIWDSIAAIFSVVDAVLKGDWDRAWESIKSIVGIWADYFSGVWENIKTVFSAVKTWFKDTFSVAWEAVKDVFSGWGDFFASLWNSIKTTFTDLGTKISDAIGGAVKAGINSVITLIENNINGAIALINGAIDLINEVPGVEIGHMDKLTLPRLSQGGVLEKGQVGLLEGDGAEAVIPLENNKKWISATAKALKSALKNEGVLTGGNGGVTNNYNFTQNNTSPKALSRLDIYRQTKNQLTLARGGLT